MSLTARDTRLCLCLPQITAEGLLAKSTSSSTLGSGGGSSKKVLTGTEQQAATESLRMQIRPRDVGPGSTQLYLVRTTVESMISLRPGSSQKNSLRKDLDQPSLLCMEQFHRHSFYWPYLLNLSGMDYILALLHHCSIIH